MKEHISCSFILKDNVFHFHDITSLLKKTEELRYFGKGCIKLTKQNLVYLNVGLGRQKVMTFGMFKNNVHYYSEMMMTPCVQELEQIELHACANARRGGLARANLT